MNIPANDAFSLNSRSHRRRSVTRSPPPKIAFFSSPPVQPRHGARKHSMTLRHRPHSNGSVSHVDGYTNGDARHALQEKAAVRRDDETVKGHTSQKIDWEIPRKALHSSIGFFVIPLYANHVSPSSVAVALSAFCTFTVSVDFVRLRSKSFAKMYEKVLGFLMRESEKEKINGVIWYLLGCIFVLTFYPDDLAVVSILVLSWCDTTASFFGRLYGSRTSRLPQSISLPFTSARLPLPFAKRKSVAGFLAGSATGTLIAFGFYGWLTPFGASPPSLPEVILDGTQSVSSLASLGKLSCIALASGFLAGFAEAIDVGSLDDNLTLPIISGGLIWALFKAVDYFFSS
ncbi:uncharacterized protein FOMMEDRAFT_124258 [Fomitiporia mediterranea MF3/22]|uniref:uncharacterized protein n=1 Tax=Fomitiporia mediterranea (strain MF3/22) TaxID=694068 RepID=UPI0004408C4A|nr:uncharacterized protein FOMMEDRAFT_124258 [Fomitiporia mediterranea MF3/22]EJD02061.1 hypothetical protein FOMMEDRAFT_124258 [Fomitiporia mediterranea MF3/22]